MTESTATLFASNRDEMFPAIAPAGQTNLGLSSSFNGAVQQLTIAPLSPDNDNKLDKQQLVMRADDAGNSLKESLRVIPQQKLGDAVFGVAKVGEACMELSSQVFNLFGPKPEEPSMAPDNDNLLKQAPTLANNTYRPGMGLGMG